MEIMATPSSANSHNQKELRLYAPPDDVSSMAMATTTNGARSPFQREVREWQRIDPDTGALLTGRLEADRWINGPLNSYGKISDSQNISQPNGTQQTQRKQLEVIQTCTAGGGAMQVIRSQTVQTTSSRWSTTSSSATASPSPPSTATTTATPTSSKDKYLKSNSKQTTPHKRTTTSTSLTKASNSPFIGTNGFHHSPPPPPSHHQHNKHHTKYHQQLNNTTTATSTTKPTRTSNANSKTPKSSLPKTTTSSSQRSRGHNLVNGGGGGRNNGNRNWPQIVTENMSSTLDICDNDHDNEHDHDNDYIVEQISDDNHDDDDSLLDGGKHHHDNEADEEEESSNRYSSFLKSQTFAPYGSSVGSDNDNVPTNGSDDLHNHHDQQHYQHHLHHDLRHNGHNSSSSCSSLNSHSGNSCSNSNQLFLLDTAPSLKLSNLMKSSSSISNSSNNSTTASQPMLVTPSSLSSNLNTNANINSSMNTHKSMASKISLHAIVGSNNSDHTTKTASSTPAPSPTTTTPLRPSWQQPTLFRQNSHGNGSNNNSNNTISPIPNPSQSTKLKHTNNSSSSHSHSHLTKSRVGDNNCCGSSSDESRSYADLRHHRQHQQHQHQQQRQSPAFHSLKQQNDRLTPTQSVLRQQQQQQQQQQQHYNRVDLESFRHYNNNNDNNNDTYVAAAAAADADDDGLRLSSRHLRRQQIPISTTSPITTNPLQRSRSISTDDLSTEWDINGADDEEPAEWRRVSKLRRSFQSSSKTQPSPPSSRRPLDLPTNSVSVSRIRAELENGRRLNTVMKNNHVDLAALSSILNGTDKESKSSPTPKRSSFLTAESLKEIRGKLKKLSDESLYKEDFIINQLNTVAQLPEQEHIEVQPTTIRRSLERSPERYRVSTVKRDPSPMSTNSKHTTKSLESRLKEQEHIEVHPTTIRRSLERSPERYRVSTVKRDPSPMSTNSKHTTKSLESRLKEQEHIEVQPTTIRRSLERSPERYRVSTVKRDPSPLPTTNKHTTNSLESRLKYKETNPTEWHLRRKSYGFEKMSPPDKSMMRMDASTDSGLGRSGELQNWSPTAEAIAAANRNSTVVHFKDSHVRASSAVNRRYRPQKSFEESENSHEEDMGLNKRHSIAVDESQYVRDNGRQTTQVRLNGFYDPSNEGKFIHTTETSSTTTAFSQRGQQKRVEFCKTEVHFATESGRVNIVETDSKPPPTNNFRRRRSRSSSVGPLQSLVKSATTVSTTSSTLSTASVGGVAMPVTLFGDDNLRRKTIASSTVAYRAPLIDSPEPKESLKNVTVTLPESYGLSESSRSSYASTSGVDTTDYETDEMTSLRGILKNKPAKPKPYVLGENIDKPDELWGVQLKPVLGKTDTLGRVQSDSPILCTAATTAALQKSVAERIRLVEQQHEFPPIPPSQPSNGFSTKINLSLGSTAGGGGVVAPNKNWEDTGLLTTTTTSIQQRRPSAQELLLQDLKEHQRILDEGLKSTTLIIKTMRSASEFDEAMRRLSIASIEAAATVQPTPMLRSNSYQESTQTQQDFDDLDLYPGNTNDNVQIYKSTSFSSTSSWSTLGSRKFSTDSRKTSSDSGTSFARQGSTPRLSFLGNEQIPVSQQLQRLRLIYDAATVSQEDEDSADEEVKSYFRGHGDSDSGGGTQESSSYEDDHCLEHTSSWSRLKAKKTIWKIDTDNGVEMAGRTLEKTDLPISNVMSIKLHSPQATTTEAPAPLKVVPPVAKPRTVANLPETPATKLHSSSSSTTATNTKQSAFQSSLPTKDSLKIIKEARGARQLRDHELSYFGVPLTKSEHEKLKTKFSTNTTTRNSPKRSLPLRRLSEETSITGTEDEIRNQWQLDHDKPDLLKHNPIVQERRRGSSLKPTERTSLKKRDELEDEDEHLYENIANDITPIFKVKEVYDRKMDLKRDAMILSELNESADQALRELSDEAALKDRKRRSLQRRNSKPLETIDEKAIAEKITESCIAVKVSRGTFASEAKKTSRHSTPSPSRAKPRERTSSQSSVECCPRARSRSLSSEKEYENVKAPTKPSRSTQMVRHKSHKPQTQSRSSSLDSQRSCQSQYSSGEEQQLRNSFRREDRSRTKTKRVSSSNSSALRQDKQREDKPSKSSTHSESKRSSSTTRSSTHKERVECHKDNAIGSTTPNQHRHHEKSSSTSGSALQRSAPVNGSGRRHKDGEGRDSQRMKRSSTTTGSGRSTSERYEKQEGSAKPSTARSSRDDERNNSARSSSHRLERNDKEKDKSSKSKAHSSRYTSQQHHHERSTTTTPATTTTHNGQEKHASSKDSKMKSSLSTATAADNTTHSKNAQQQQQHPQHHSHHHTASKPERHQRSSKGAEAAASSSSSKEHVYGLKSAIIKTTTKLRDKSRARKDKK